MSLDFRFNKGILLSDVPLKTEITINTHENSILLNHPNGEIVHCVIDKDYLYGVTARGGVPCEILYNLMISFNIKFIDDNYTETLCYNSYYNPDMEITDFDLEEIYNNCMIEYGFEYLVFEEQYRINIEQRNLKIEKILKRNN